MNRSNQMDVCVPKPGGIGELTVIALPMVVSSACETLMMFVDRLFVSKLGPEYVSAAMGGGITAFMFMTFFLGLTGYSNALVAQYLGSGRKERCGLAVGQALFIALLAYPVMLLCVPLGELLFKATRVAPLQLVPQREYFRILMWGTLLGLTRSGLSSFFSGIGRTRIVMLSAAVSMVVNIIANYVLIFGHFGFPALGIRGAAIGTITGSAVGLSVMIVKYLGPRYRHEYGILRGLRFDWQVMRTLLHFGTPSGLEFFLNLFAFNLLVLNFHSYGVAQAAAMSITFSWEMFSFIPLIGVGIAVTSLVGRYMGAGDPDTAHKVAMSGVKMACAYSVLTFTAFLFFAEPMIEMFRPADGGAAFADVIPLGVFMLRMVSLYVFADAMSIVLSSALRGAGDTFWSMVVSVSCHWCFTIAAVVLVHVFDADPRVTWVTVVVLITGMCVAFVFRYRGGKWRSMTVVQPVT